MLRFVLALVFTLVSITARADEGPSLKIPPGGTLRGAFAEDHYFLSDSKPLHTEGHFLIAPGRGILWAVEKPVPFNFIITADGLTQALGTYPLIQIPAAKMPMIAEATPLICTTLGGDWGPLEREFVVARKSTAKHWDATITPREGTKMPFQSVSFAGNKQIDQARAMRKNGGFDKFTFSDQTVSAAPPTAEEIAAFRIAVVPRK